MRQLQRGIGICSERVQNGFQKNVEKFDKEDLHQSIQVTNFFSTHFKNIKLHITLLEKVNPLIG